MSAQKSSQPDFGSSKLIPSAQEIAAALREGPSAIVLGSGITATCTRNAATATFRGLLNHAAGYAKAKGLIPARQYDEMLGALASESPRILETLPVMLEKVLGKDFVPWLHEALGKLRSMDERVPRTIQRFARQGIRLATTNLDSVVEDAAGLPSVTWQDLLSRDLASIPIETVIHLDGVWSAPASVQFGSNAGEAHEMANFLFLQRHRTFLFVGMGMGLSVTRLWRLLRSLSCQAFFLHRFDDVSWVMPMVNEVPQFVPVGYGPRFEDLPAFLDTILQALGDSTPQEDLAALEAFWSDGARVAKCVARAALRERSFCNWLQNPEPAKLLEAMRVLGVRSAADILQSDVALAQAFPGFEPDPLWREWFIRTQVPRLREALMPVTRPELNAAEQPLTPSSQADNAPTPLGVSTANIHHYPKADRADLDDEDIEWGSKEPPAVRAKRKQSPIQRKKK